MLFYAAFLMVLGLSTSEELSLGGVVFDLNAAAVSDVQIVVEHTTDRQQWQAVTKEDGTFRFDRMSLGTYRVTVRKEGYFETSTEVRLESSKTIEFTLAPVETLKQSIEVVARPDPINTDSVASQNTVNEEVIQTLQYTGKRDFLNALTLMPGVMRDNNGQVHIHGSRGDQVRYQVDGMNLTDASGGGLSARIPLEAIESVDTDLAGYSAEFGKGSGGIVRVHSQFVGNRYRFSLTDFFPGVNFKKKTISDFSPRLLFSGPIVQGKLWFMYSSSLRYVRTYLDDLPNHANGQTETVADQLVKLQWNLHESHVLTFNLLHNSEYLGNIGLSIFRPEDATTNTLRRGMTLAVSDRKVAGRKLLETTVQWTRRRDTDLAKGHTTFEARPDVWLGNFFTDRRGRNQRFHSAQTLAWEQSTGGLRHRLKAGGEFDYVISSLQLDKRPFVQYAETGALRASVTFVGPNSAGVRNHELGVFMLDRIVLNPSVQVELGVRVDRESVVGRNNASPRAGFSWLPLGTNRSKISGGAGLFYDNVALINLQLPRMQRRYMTVYDTGTPVPVAIATDVRVNPGLRNPSGLHWNLAWEHEWAPRWVSRVNYIEKRGRDQIRLAAVGNGPGFDIVVNNSGKSDYKGIELSLDRPIRTNLRILASYVYSRSTGRPSVSLDFPDPSIEMVREAPLDWNIPHRLITWAYFPVPGNINASYSIEARSGFPYSTVDDLNQLVGGYNSHTMPATFVTNINVEKEIPIPFKKRMAVRIGVTNLFNRFNPRVIDPNVNSLYFMRLSDSSGRHFVGRIRILKK
ncbi:MAG TPA: TonB-dependent receptor [Terriglobia bacterium]|nr:TonB-dependent receptor [Terriglobia bacterium]